MLEVLTFPIEAFCNSSHGWVLLEDGMGDLDCAGELITLGFVDSSKGTSPQNSGVGDGLGAELCLTSERLAVAISHIRSRGVAQK